ncbi:MAG: bactofilin family protein, partial [Thermodesulfovibrionales bacterium]
KKNDKVETFIGSNAIFKGEIRTDGAIRIDGAVEGNVAADWVILGEKGSIRGDVMAHNVVVGGRIEGNVRTKGMIEIKNKGRIIGDILTPKLSIVEGGIIEGRTSMQGDGSGTSAELQPMEK